MSERLVVEVGTFAIIPGTPHKLICEDAHIARGYAAVLITPTLTAFQLRFQIDLNATNYSTDSRLRINENQKDAVMFLAERGPCELSELMRASSNSAEEILKLGPCILRTNPESALFANSETVGLLYEIGKISPKSIVVDLAESVLTSRRIAQMFARDGGFDGRRYVTYRIPDAKR